MRIEIHQEKPQLPNNQTSDGSLLLSQDPSILIVCVILTLSWIVNGLISSRYTGRFHFRNKKGTKISAELNPPTKKH
jgi:hypothetical protein